MKIAKETFHGPDRLTVVAGEVYADDADVVKRHPGKFAEPEQLAEQRHPRSHSARPVVEDATARPGEQSNARALKPRKRTAKDKDAPADDEGSAKADDALVDDKG